MRDTGTEEQRVENELGHGNYGAGALDIPTRSDREGADEVPAELSSTVEGDPDELLNGGPTRTPGMRTTTGGKAGPNNVKPHSNHGPGVAPTTTGDATTGGFTTSEGATSDASTHAL